MAKVFLRHLKLFQLMIVIVTVTDVAVDGNYNGCFDARWTYHGHSRTCFKLFSDEITWDKAHRKCQCHATSWGRCLKSSLAVIKDEQTNDFVKGLLPSDSTSAYIGLYKDEEEKPERWTDTDETTTYRDFATSSRGYSTFKTYMKKDRWYQTRGAYRFMFVCQTKAVNDPMTIGCPDPVRVSLETTKISFFCTLDFVIWDSVKWTDSFALEVASCLFNKTCTSSIAQIYTSSMAANKKSTTLTYKGEITRALEGPWGCSIFDEYRPTDKLLDKKSCDLTIYEPAEDISCRSQVTSDWVLVTCLVEKIYPEATCFWKYKNIDEDTYSKPIPADIIAPFSDEYTDVMTKYKYYTTRCQLNMTRENVKFVAGTLVVKVRVAPNVGNYLVPKEDRRFQQTTVDIEIPGTPVFKFTNDSLLESQTVSYLEGERMRIICEVPGGNPVVYRTTMSCTFAISGVEKMDASRGPRYTLDTHATRDMNAGSCNCWGHHITQPTASSKIQFRIWIPSDVLSFKSNPVQPQEGQRVTLTCQGMGEPEPHVGISTNNKNVQITDEMSKTSLSVSFTADCQKIGRYTCTTENTIKSDLHRDFEHLDLAVVCPPTSCGGHHHVPSFVRRLHGEVQMTLCALGFPVPNKDQFILYRDFENGSVPDEVPGSFYGLELITEGKTLKGINLTFSSVEAKDMGAYKLYYPKTEWVDYSFLKFKLTSEGPPLCPDDFSVQEVGHDSVILTLTPGYSYTGKQTVELLGVSSPPASVVLSSLGKVEVQGDKVITHKVTGLKPDTDYWIGFDTINDNGLTTCTDNTVNATTLTHPHAEGAQSEGSQTGTDYTPVGVGVFLGLLLIIIVAIAIAFLYWRRKKKQKDLYPSNQLNQPSDGPSPYSAVDSHTYSNHCEAVRLCESSAAVVNGTSETPTESSAYDTLPARESNVYSNSSAIEADGEDISDKLYSNYPEPEVDSPSQQKAIRKRKQKELLYVDVVIDPTSQRPEFTERAPPSTKKEETVEYVFIDPAATRARLNEKNNSMPTVDQEED